MAIIYKRGLKFKDGNPYAEQGTKNVPNSVPPERVMDPVGFEDTNSSGHPPFWYINFDLPGERERQLSKDYACILKDRFKTRGRSHAESKDEEKE